MMFCAPSLANAADAPAYPTVEQNLQAMDTDHDGQVTVYELRAYLEARHGKDYQQEVMDSLEASAKGKSCGTPFARSFY
ncbi:hypothetical protein LG200_03650 [Methylobacillus caricis]|uniref:hypothetical protein n=1 Tax=Methylobacillus caricis TaxID=1971611 RepID=UPI001D00147D|nr:hypothetical protein [Methylobacillus caricis]MCB5187101.1 hypothetical protein [Methylobacillus caricis]